MTLRVWAVSALGLVPSCVAVPETTSDEPFGSEMGPPAVADAASDRPEVAPAAPDAGRPTPPDGATAIRDASPHTVDTGAVLVPDASADEGVADAARPPTPEMARPAPDMARPPPDLALPPPPDLALPPPPDAGVLLLAEGQPCADPGVAAACTLGLICDDFSREEARCRAEWGVLGAPCWERLDGIDGAPDGRVGEAQGTLDDHGRVGGGGTCLAGSACGSTADEAFVCVPTLELGAACDPAGLGGWCRRGAVCSPGSSGPTCILPRTVDEGAPCVEGACRPGLSCVGPRLNRRCRRVDPPEGSGSLLGGECLRWSDCLEGGCQRPDDQAPGICAWGAVGENCPCDAGLLCAGGECVRPLWLEAGDACRLHEECGAGLRCNHATGLCQRPQSSAEGDRCLRQAFCAPGAMCLGDSLGAWWGTCRAWTRLDEPCGWELPPCQPPLACLEGPAGARCAFPALVGQPCDLGRPCVYPFRCEVVDGAEERICR